MNIPSDSFSYDVPLKEDARRFALKGTEISGKGFFFAPTAACNTTQQGMQPAFSMHSYSHSPALTKQEDKRTRRERETRTRTDTNSISVAAA